MSHFVSDCCRGERCWCRQPAAHKVEEVAFEDHPRAWHPLSTYVCHAHFVEMMGPAAKDERDEVPTRDTRTVFGSG